MGGMYDYKLVMAMVGLQCFYAGNALLNRGALLEGMNPRVFVVYRQIIATLVIAPVAYFSNRRKSNSCSLGWRSFTLIFLTSLFGVTIYQNLYFEGLYLASSSIASAMTNLTPAITFMMAAIVGFEKVRNRSLRSIAKVAGTACCVCGAVSMALLRGPKLLNSELLPRKSLLGGDNWLLGCLLLFGSCCSWSVWLILQVPAAACYPDHLSFTAWMCFFSTIQSAAFTLFFERDPGEWRPHSILEIACYVYSGVIGSAVAFFVQAWCVSKRGPLFTVVFCPLCTVIVTILASLFLHEEVYTGSLAGAIAAIIGLYVVLWGKAEDLEDIKEEANQKLPNDQNTTVQLFIDEPPDQKISCKIDLEEPLLSDKSIQFDKSQMASHNDGCH